MPYQLGSHSASAISKVLLLYPKVGTKFRLRSTRLRTFGLNNLLVDLASNILSGCRYCTPFDNCCCNSSEFTCVDNLLVKTIRGLAATQQDQMVADRDTKTIPKFFQLGISTLLTAATILQLGVTTNLMKEKSWLTSRMTSFHQRLSSTSIQYFGSF
ncbi:hypothetical protein JTE90_001190 [Oedothorax gibbosus]|uniref:Uncharacterized protein n=1 Tax=Oedothorax gibbosus TaxID=931172 RepID=A0AAV6UWY9_9ARAC|nr:hypothetical protein JTE90_001190 [Oedothorax gibbosus]